MMALIKIGSDLIAINELERLLSMFIEGGEARLTRVETIAVAPE